MSKKKKRRKKKTINWSREDFHHILFQKRYWEKNYAKMLRMHPYAGKYIPQLTLHREIHAKVRSIPVPEGSECRRAYLELLRLEREGLIDVESDSVEQRIDFFVNIWSNSSPSTVHALLEQKDIVSKFYCKGDL